MVRKAQYSPEDVVIAAFKVVAQFGIEHLTARKVAQVLGSSTAPVYSNFGSMEDLESAAFALAADRMLEYALQEHTPDRFLNMGIGVLDFARDFPRWYVAFSLKEEANKEIFRQITETLLEEMGHIPLLAPLTLLEKSVLLLKMEIFTHGIAWRIIQGNVPPEEIPGLIQLLDEVGTSLAADALAQSPRKDEDLMRLAKFCHD